jgi:regulator of RNase E activity RraA
MAARFASYEPNQIVFIFGGADITEGLADGQFIQIVQPTDFAQTVVGTDGEVVRSRSNDYRAQITLSLLQTSEANDILSAAYNADRTSSNGVVVAIAIRDAGNGRQLYAASEAWIGKAPDVTFDRTATARQWRIDCANLARFDGGSS